jgi:hypothetical protein
LFTAIIPKQFGMVIELELLRERLDADEVIR